VNAKMDALYNDEVRRTNRIGVGPTGVHEFAMKFFGFGFYDMLDESKSIDFWKALGSIAQAVKNEAVIYSKKLGVNTPHTDTTVKPAGTTSKLFGLTEGAHLPSMREYVRWVQFREDDPLVSEYRGLGYPIKVLRTYKNTVVVGFPTVPIIMDLAREMGLEDKIVTAAEATMDEQFVYLKLLEKWWINGGDALDQTGNQISYTMKFNPEKVDREMFEQAMVDHMSKVKCCSVMPQEDQSAYEYLPEQPVSKGEFEAIARAIAGSNIEESVDYEHLACASGACPISFDKNGI
jgi:hypothetical protein